MCGVHRSTSVVASGFLEFTVKVFNVFLRLGLYSRESNTQAVCGREGFESPPTHNPH